MALTLHGRLRDACRARSVPLFLALGINAFGGGMFFPFALLYYQAATALPVSTIGVALTGATLVTLAANPVAGILVDRIGSRRIVVLALCLESAGFIAYMVVSSAATLFAAALFATGGSRGFYAAYSSLIAESVEDGGRERWYGLVGITQKVGASLSGLLASVVIGSVGLRRFRMIILGNICCLLVSAWLIHLSRPARDLPDQDPAVANVGYRVIFRDRTFLLLIGSNLCFVTCSMLVGLGFVVYAIDDLGAPLWVLGVIGVAQTVLTMPLQTRVTEMMRGTRRSRIIMLSSGIWLMAALGYAGAVLISAAVLVPYLIVVAVVFSAAQWFHGPASRALAAGMGPAAARGRYIASFELSWGMAAAATPVVFGLLYGVAPVAPWLAMVGFIVLGAGLVRLAEPGIAPGRNTPARRASPVRASSRS